MGQPHPTLTLILDIDKRLDSPNLQQEIKRDYAYVGSTLIRTHEPESSDAPIENTMNLVLKLGRRQYLYSSDEGADDLWNNFLEHWFYNAFHKLGNHMKIYNRRQREIGMPELIFDWLVFELQNGKLRVRMHTDSNSDILPDTNVWLTTIRSALNDGSLGADVTQVTLPAPEYYEQQLQAGLAAAAERKKQAAAEQKRLTEQEAARAAQQEAQAEAAFLESPQLAAQEAAAAAAQQEAEAQACSETDPTHATSGMNATGTENTSETSAPEPETHTSDFDHEAYNEEADYSFDEPLFAVDYGMWSVAYIDGRVRLFDSHAHTFVNE